MFIVEGKKTGDVALTSKNPGGAQVTKGQAGILIKTTNQKDFTPVKKKNSFKPKKGSNGKDKAKHYTLLDPLDNSKSEEDLEEMVLETQVDILRLEKSRLF